MGTLTVIFENRNPITTEMKKYIFIFLIYSLFISCNNFSDETVDKISFNSNLSSSNKIVFRNRKPNQMELSRNDSCFENSAIHEIATKSGIDNFKKLFSNSTYSGYCCCPESTMLVEFYKDSEKIETYIVDTTEFKSKVRIFEKAYQYSFLVNKNSWNEFLKSEDK